MAALCFSNMRSAPQLLTRWRRPGWDAVIACVGGFALQTEYGSFFRSDVIKDTEALFSMIRLQCFIYFSDLYYPSQTPMKHLHTFNCAKGKAFCQNALFLFIFTFLLVCCCFEMLVNEHNGATMRNIQNDGTMLKFAIRKALFVCSQMEQTQ